METKDNSKPTTPLHGNNHHEDVIKVSTISNEITHFLVFFFFILFRLFYF